MSDGLDVSAEGVMFLEDLADRITEIITLAGPNATVGVDDITKKILEVEYFQDEIDRWIVSTEHMDNPPLKCLNFLIKPEKYAGESAKIRQWELANPGYHETNHEPKFRLPTAAAPGNTSQPTVPQQQVVELYCEPIKPPLTNPTVKQLSSQLCETVLGVPGVTSCTIYVLYENGLKFKVDIEPADTPWTKLPPDHFTFSVWNNQVTSAVRKEMYCRMDDGDICPEEILPLHELKKSVAAVFKHPDPSCWQEALSRIEQIFQRKSTAYWDPVALYILNTFHVYIRWKLSEYGDGPKEDPHKIKREVHHHLNCRKEYIMKHSKDQTKQKLVGIIKQSLCAPMLVNVLREVSAKLKGSSAPQQTTTTPHPPSTTTTTTTTTSTTTTATSNDGPQPTVNVAADDGTSTGYITPVTMGPPHQRDKLHNPNEVDAQYDEVWSGIAEIEQLMLVPGKEQLEWPVFQYLREICSATCQSNSNDCKNPTCQHLLGLDNDTDDIFPALQEYVLNGCSPPLMERKNTERADVVVWLDASPIPTCGREHPTIFVYAAKGKDTLTYEVESNPLLNAITNGSGGYALEVPDDDNSSIQSSGTAGEYGDADESSCCLAEWVSKDDNGFSVNNCQWQHELYAGLELHRIFQNETFVKSNTTRQNVTIITIGRLARVSFPWLTIEENGPRLLDICHIFSAPNLTNLYLNHLWLKNTDISKPLIEKIAMAKGLPEPARPIISQEKPLMVDLDRVLDLFDVWEEAHISQIHLETSARNREYTSFGLLTSEKKGDLLPPEQVLDYFRQQNTKNKTLLSVLYTCWGFPHAYMYSPVEEDPRFKGVAHALHQIGQIWLLGAPGTVDTEDVQCVQKYCSQLGSRTWIDLLRESDPEDKIRLMKWLASGGWQEQLPCMREEVVRVGGSNTGIAKTDKSLHKDLSDHSSNPNTQWDVESNNNDGGDVHMQDADPKGPSDCTTFRVVVIGPRDDDIWKHISCEPYQQVEAGGIAAEPDMWKTLTGRKHEIIRTKVHVSNKVLGDTLMQAIKIIHKSGESADWVAALETLKRIVMCKPMHNKDDLTNQNVVFMCRLHMHYLFIRWKVWKYGEQPDDQKENINPANIRKKAKWYMNEFNDFTTKCKDVKVRATLKKLTCTAMLVNVSRETSREPPTPPGDDPPSPPRNSSDPKNQLGGEFQGMCRGPHPDGICYEALGLSMCPQLNNDPMTGWELEDPYTRGANGELAEMLNRKWEDVEGQREQYIRGDENRLYIWASAPPPLPAMDGQPQLSISLHYEHSNGSNGEHSVVYKLGSMLDDAITCGSDGFTLKCEGTLNDGDNGPDMCCWEYTGIPTSRIDWQQLIYDELELHKIFEEDRFTTGSDGSDAHLSVTFVSFGRLDRLRIHLLKGADKIPLLDKCHIFKASSVTENYLHDFLKLKQDVQVLQPQHEVNNLNNIVDQPQPWLTIVPTTNTNIPETHTGYPRAIRAKEEHVGELQEKLQTQDLFTILRHNRHLMDCTPSGSWNTPCPWIRHTILRCSNVVEGSVYHYWDIWVPLHALCPTTDKFFIYTRVSQEDLLDFKIEIVSSVTSEQWWANSKLPLQGWSEGTDGFRGRPWYLPVPVELFRCGKTAQIQHVSPEFVNSELQNACPNDLDQWRICTLKSTNGDIYYKIHITPVDATVNNGGRWWERVPQTVVPASIACMQCITVTHGGGKLPV